MSLAQPTSVGSPLGAPVWATFPSRESGARSRKESKLSVDDIGRPGAASNLSELTTISDSQDTSQSQPIVPDSQDANQSQPTIVITKPPRYVPPFNQDVDILVSSDHEDEEETFAQLLRM